MSTPQMKESIHSKSFGVVVGWGGSEAYSKPKLGRAGSSNFS